MKKIILCIALVVLVCLAVLSACSADAIWDYQAVKADGNGSHPLVNAPAYDSSENVIQANKVTIEGVALAGMNELWNSASQYTIFVQDDTHDRGGIQVWAGNFGWYQPPVTWRPAQYVSFVAGDRVRVTGFLGDHSGKVFINDRHCNDLDVCFTVQVIGHPGLPNPELIPSIANCNYFDQARNDGGERYQTRLTMLHGVQITSGTWANNSTLTISDATGSTSLFLPPMGNFTGTAQPTGKISIVGIYDQEDPGSGHPVQYHGNYRMILKNTEDIAVALDACRETRERSDGEQVALANKIVSRAYSGYFFIQDADRAGGLKVISDHLVTTGDAVSVMGTVSTVGGERVLLAKYIAKSRNAAKPLGVNGKTLRGESGLDVFGLLVRCVGRIGNNLGGGIYEFIDYAGEVIRLNSNGYAVPAQGTLVTITAVASGDSSMPMLLLGSAGDIQQVD